MAKINLRSPRYLKVSNVSLSYAVLKLYVYSGELTTDKPATPQYTITKKEVGSNNYVIFEIAELVRDYIEHTFNGDYVNADNEVLWAESDIELFDSSDASLGNSNTNDTAFDGYGYFEDGINPQLEQPLLQTNTCIYKPDDSPLRIPIDTNAADNVTFFFNGQQIYNKAISASTESKDQIEYVSNVANDIDGFRDRVLEDGGTFEDNTCIESFLDEYTIFPVDTVYISGVYGVDILTVKNIEECKYEPLKITFINRFGALQDFWFFKKSVKNLSVKSSDFKRNILDESSLSFGNGRPVNVFDLTAKDSITLNSGYVNENQSSAIEELLLSEDVWISIDTTDPAPVNVKTKTMQYKTSVNDNLINHTIDFEFAYNKINDIR